MGRAKLPAILGSVLIALLYAGLAIVSGLDRMSADQPAVAVPGFASVEAARQRALRALTVGDRSAALAAARAALARDPVDARSVGLFGQALLESGDPAGARHAFAVARTLGWREPFTQLYWLGTMLDAGDYRHAADHLDAILRQAPGLGQRNLLLARFDADPAGRLAIAARLSRHPPWAANYFYDTRNPLAGDPAARSEVAELLSDRFGVRDCALVAPLLEALARRRRFDETRAIYSRHCAMSGEAASPVDGGFERASTVAMATALDWRFAGEGTIGVLLGPAPGARGRAAIASSTAARTLPFAFQLLTLPPGRYRVSWRAVDARGAPSAAIDAYVSCDDLVRPWLAKAADPSRGRFAAWFTLPPSCAKPTLALGIGAGADAVAVDDVRIDVAGPPPLSTSIGTTATTRR